MPGAGFERRQPSQDSRPGIDDGSLVDVKGVVVVVKKVKIVVKRVVKRLGVGIMSEVEGLGHLSALRSWRFCNSGEKLIRSVGLSDTCGELK